MKLFNFITAFCCLIFLIFSKPVFSESNATASAEENADQANSDFLSKLINKSSTNLKQVVSSVFEELGHDHNSTVLSSLFPEAEEAVRTRLHRLEQCFSSKIKGGSEVKLFEEPLSSIVHKTIVVYWPAIEDILNDDQWLERLKEKVRTLVGTIKGVARHVIACLQGLDDPKFEPTKLALNRFALTSSAEWKAILKPLPPPLGKPLQLEQQQQPNQQPTKSTIQTATKHLSAEFDTFDVNDISDDQVPDSFDYRDQGVVGVIKDQGGGNTCFLFAAIAALESSYMLKHRKELRGSGGSGGGNSTKIISFSEKDAYNCLAATEVLSNPANGGHVLALYNLYKKNRDRSGLIFTEQAPDPYDFIPGKFSIPPELHPAMCHSDRSLDRAQVIGFASPCDIPASEEGLLYLKKVLLNYGPVTTRFRTDCGHEGMDGEPCPWDKIVGPMNEPCVDTSKYPLTPHNHAMLVIGWTPTHLIIKNSYGDYDSEEDGGHWGEKGFLYLNYKYLENCGVLGSGSELTFPEVD